MAIIQYGSFDDFSAGVMSDILPVGVPVRAKRLDIPLTVSKATRQTAGKGLVMESPLKNVKTFSVLREVTRKVQPVPVQFYTSPSSRGLALKSLELTRGFEGLLGNMFKSTNNVYFLAWAWDFSGKPAVQYPGVGVPEEKCIIPLKVGDIREFLGEGIVLFPTRKVTAGLALRIMLWECDQSIRSFGKAISDVADTIKSSQLDNLMSLISLSASGATTVTVDLVLKAALELSTAIGIILKANGDDYVDFYEGYYPAKDRWTSGQERHKSFASEIVLSRLA